METEFGRKKALFLKPGKYAIHKELPPMREEATQPIKFVRMQKKKLSKLLSFRKTDRRKSMQIIENLHIPRNRPKSSVPNQYLVDPSIFPEGGREERLLMERLTQRSDRNLRKLRKLYYSLKDEKSRINRLERMYHDELDQNKILSASSIRLDRSLRHLQCLIREIENEKLEQRRVLGHFREAMIVKDTLLVGTLKKEQIAIEKLTSVIAKYRAIELSRWKYIQEIFRIAGKSRQYKSVDVYNLVHHMYHIFESSKPKRFRRAPRSAGFHVFPDELYKGEMFDRYPNFIRIYERASREQIPLSRYVEGKDLGTFRNQVIENHRIIIQQNNTLLRNRVNSDDLDGLNPSYITKEDVMGFIENVYSSHEHDQAKSLLEEIISKVNVEMNKHFKIEKTEATIFRHIKGLTRAIRSTLAEVRSELASGDFVKDIKLDYIYEYFAKTNTDWESRMEEQKRYYEVRLYEDVNEMRDSLKKKCDEKIRILQEKLEIAKKSDRSKQQIQILKERIKNSEGKIKSFFMKSEELRKELEETNKEMNKLKNQNSTLVEELEETKLLGEQDISSKDVIANELKSRISEFEIEMEVKKRETNSEKSKLENQLNEKTERIMLLVGEQRQSLQRMEKMRDEIKDYRNRLGLKDDEDLEHLRDMEEKQRMQEERGKKEEEERRRRRMRSKYQQTSMSSEELERIVTENQSQKKEILMLQNPDGESDRVEIIRAPPSPKKPTKEQLEAERRQKQLEKERKKLKEKVLDLTNKLQETPTKKDHLEKIDRIEELEMKVKPKLRRMETKNRELHDFVNVQTNRALKYRRQKEVMRREYETKVTKMRSTILMLKKKVELTINNRKVVQKEGTENCSVQTDFSSLRANIFQFLQMMQQKPKPPPTRKKIKKKKKGGGRGGGGGSSTSTTTTTTERNRKNSRELKNKLQNYSSDELSENDTNKIVQYMVKKYEQMKRKKSAMNRYSFDNFNNIPMNKKNKKKRKGGRKSNTPVPKVETFEDFRDNEKKELEKNKTNEQKKVKKRSTLPQIFDFNEKFGGLDQNFEKIRRKKSVNRNRLKKLMIMSDPNRLMASEKMMKEFNKRR